MSHSEPPLFDAVVRIDRLPAAGRSLEVSLDGPTRAALADVLKIASVEQFDASLTVTPMRGGLREIGRASCRERVFTAV